MASHKMMVPLDGLPLTEKALPFATKLAKNLDAELLLLRSASPSALNWYVMAIQVK